MTFEERFRFWLGVGLGAGLSLLGLRRGATWAVVAGVFVIAAGAGGSLLAWSRRRAALSRPFPEEWRAILSRHVRFYRRLDDAGRRRFEGLVQRLAADFHFEGVAGAEVTDEVRVLALAGGAVLLFGNPSLELDATRDIVIYPDAFDDDYDIGRDGPIAGMVHRQGPLLFSARALRQGWERSDDAYNVALHEFAHVLDLADGYADGVPGIAADPDAWDPLLTDALERVRARRSRLRPYAGTNRAELFAVAVEAYFERPRDLRRAHPELYEALRDVFGIDPLALERAPRGRRRGRRKRRARR